MKNIFYSASMLFVIALLATGCNKNSPKATAEKFLNGLFHYDYEAAKKVSTEETKNMIDLMAQFSAVMPDSIKEEAKNIRIDIKNVEEKENTAVVTYTTSDEPDADKKLHLIKENEQWLVQYSKMNELNDGGDLEEDAMPFEEETSTTDTSMQTL